MTIVGTYYICGPMRPIEDNNFPLFIRASRILRADGVDIISPHELGQPDWTRGQLMGDDIVTLIKACDGIIALPDWQKSPGASAEVACAFACELPVYDLLLHDDDTYTLLESNVVSVRVPRENQYRDRTPLVGLCGFAQSGKDTAASFLVDKFDWTRVAFADALRDVLYALNPVVPIHEGAEAAERGWSTLDLSTLVDSRGWDDVKTSFSYVRELLQRLGTEAGRQIIDENLWVGMGEDKIERAGGPVVVTDCRFPNEIALIRRRKGLLIWVERDGVGAVNGHASEHSVNKADCDLVLTNNGTIDDLYESLSQAFGTLVTT